MIEEGAQKSVASRVGNSPNLIDKKMKEKKKGKYLLLFLKIIHTYSFS